MRLLQPSVRGNGSFFNGIDVRTETSSPDLTIRYDKRDITLGGCLLQSRRMCTIHDKP